MPPQIRSGLRGFFNVMKQKNFDIKPQVLEITDKSPFGEMIRLISSNAFESKETQKDPALINRVISLWSKKDNAFKIGEDLYHITPEDVARIFGFPLRGIVLDLNKKSSRDDYNYFYDKYIDKKEPNLTRKSLEHALHRAIASNDVTDTAILLIQLLLCTFFFTTTASTISWTLANLCLDITGLNQYDWPIMILDYLKTGLNKGSAGICGCAPLIMYWLADRTNLCAKISGRDGLPFTFCSWKLTDLSNKFASNDDISAALKAALKESVEEDFEEDLKEKLCDLGPKEDLPRRDEEAKKILMEEIETLKLKLDEKWKTREEIEAIAALKAALKESVEEDFEEDLKEKLCDLGPKEDLPRRDEEAEKILMEEIETLKEETEAIAALKAALKEFVEEDFEEDLKEKLCDLGPKEDLSRREEEAKKILMEEIETLKLKLDEKWKTREEIEAMEAEVKSCQALLSAQKDTITSLQEENAKQKHTITTLEEENSRLRKLVDGIDEFQRRRNQSVESSLDEYNETEVGKTPCKLSPKTKLVRFLFGLRCYNKK